MAKKTIYTKDGVEVNSSSDKYKGHIFYDEDGVGYKCLGYQKKLDDCVYLNLKTKQEVVGCMDGFYYNKPIHVVSNNGYGKVINQLYNQWTAVKTEKEYANWQEKVRSAVFGTYGDIPIEQVLENFDFGNAAINSFHLKTFKQELKTAYKGIKYAKGGKIEVGNQVEIELNNGKIIIGTLEKENPIKVRTDSTSTQVIPNGLIKSIKRSDKYCCGGRFAEGGNVANKGFNYEIGGL